MFTIAGLMLSIAGVVMLTLSMNALRIYNGSRLWPKVSATIVTSVAHPTPNDGEISYRPVIEFEYWVNNVKYSSNRHSEGLPFPVTEQSVRNLVASHPVGKIVQVAVKPDDPTFAILDTGLPQHMITVRRIGGISLTIGILLLVAAIITHI